MEIVQYYQTNNPCYKAGRKITPSGIVVHSTGANNPNLKRYVGPDDGILGKNQYNNHWNQSDANKCVHAFIGRVADGSLKIYQTLPWNHRCWGVGSGKKGSYNSTHIQFEICEDGLKDESYYKEAFDLAIRLSAFLCKEYGIKPENVVGHYEAWAAGYGSNHGDPKNWQKKFGGSMDEFRASVAALIGGNNSPAEVIISKAEEQTAVTQKPVQKPQETKETGSVVIAMQTLRNGNKGTQVKVLQWLLADKGHYHGKPDGIFGPNTLSAVKGFQKMKGLTVDGVVGAQTWLKLLA
jgi:N-acetylmuramoyl-L-alanine amidase